MRSTSTSRHAPTRRGGATNPRPNREESHSRFIDVVGLLRRAPRTGPELSELTGISIEMIRKYIYLIEGEGLIEVDGTRRTELRGPPQTQYRWRELDHFRPDAAATETPRVR